MVWGSWFKGLRERTAYLVTVFICIHWVPYMHTYVHTCIHTHTDTRTCVRTYTQNTNTCMHATPFFQVLTEFWPVKEILETLSVHHCDAQGFTLWSVQFCFSFAKKGLPKLQTFVGSEVRVIYRALIPSSYLYYFGGSLL